MKSRLRRLGAMFIKELVQLRRDRLTLATMLLTPIVQLLLFGYAINVNPKELPSAVVLGDNSPQARTVIQAFKHSEYYDFSGMAETETEAARLLQQGQVKFILTIPTNFSRDLLRGDQPALLLQADAADSVAVTGAAAALSDIVSSAFRDEFTGPLEYLAPTPLPIKIQVHALYNPEQITAYNIVPGLVGVLLTTTTVVMTALAMTKERERGTMENLLAMAIHPSEVLVGKIVPYVFVGYAQTGIILLIARYQFKVPTHGSFALLLVASLVFIVANLALGIMISTVAKNQKQALQLAVFVMLPSILLSEFMFPFKGMPGWAQAIGECLPVTHFIRITRGVMLKGTGFADVGLELWPVLLFTVVVVTVAIKRYRKTLD